MTPGFTKLSEVAVNLHDRRIGTITRLASEQQIFAFDQSYIDDPARPTLSLFFKDRTGGLNTTAQHVRRRVPAFFSNLLPEGHLRTYLAELAGVKPEREFFLLAALGSDLAGAVTITPLRYDGGRDDAFEEPRDSGDPLRFSLAGVQLKFSAIAESSGGLTIPAKGVGGSWIVKLPSMRFSSVSENEFAMLELARAVGITTPRSRLIPVKEIGGLPGEAARIAGNALAVERFDRAPNGKRIHMEDFAQVFGLFPSDKYKHASYGNIARVLWAEIGDVGTYEFVRRLVFSVLIGNADMHLKNWSILYPDTRKPALSPAYDFISTVPYIPNDRLALSFGGSRALDEITIDQMRRLADKGNLPVSPIIRLAQETVARTVDAWRTLAAKDLLPAELVSVIHTQIETAAARAIT